MFADADIAAITDYIELANRSASERLGEQLYEACCALKDFPEGFALASGIEKLGVRRRNVGADAIFYILRSADILVLRVVHGSRDYPRLFIDQAT